MRKRRPCVWTNRIIDPAERFWMKVDKNGPIPENRPDLGPCWRWTGYVDRDGYARIHHPGGVRAHRLSLTVAGIDVPAGLHVDHLCRNRACVNPDHLEPVPLAVNTRRGNAPSMIVARTGVCQRGHAMTDDNVIVGSRGRQCKTCKTMNNRKRSLKNRVSA